MSTPLLDKRQRERMKQIFALYLQDEDNMKDGDRLKTYEQVVYDMRGLVSGYIVRKMLKEFKPELARAMETKRKHHYMKI